MKDALSRLVEIERTDLVLAKGGHDLEVFSQDGQVLTVRFRPEQAGVLQELAEQLSAQLAAQLATQTAGTGRLK